MNTFPKKKYGRPMDMWKSAHHQLSWFQIANQVTLRCEWQHILKSLEIDNIGRVVERKKPFPLLVGIFYGSFSSAIWRSFKNIETELPYNPVIPLISTYFKNRKTLIWKDTYIPNIAHRLSIIDKIK